MAYAALFLLLCIYFYVLLIASDCALCKYVCVCVSPAQAGNVAC